MELGRLEIPAELSALLKIAEGRQHVMAENITEALPPEITAQESLALPPDIDRFPFSRFIPENFEKPILPSPGKPLTSPLTHLDGANLQLALDINKVMLRLLGDLSLQSWQEQTMGTYLAQQGLRHPTLRNEIFCQLVTQLWHNLDEQQCHRGWALMAILLSAFTPTLTLQKPLLKFVSDHAPKGIAAVCQHKLLGALQRPQAAINTVRAYPPTQLEWISGWRCGRMALDVFTFSEECYSAEVKSWTTGEEFAGWILQSKGIEQPIRGWSVSLLSEDSWQDLVGCDFVLDLIGHTEDLGDSSAPCSYPIPSHNVIYQDIPPPPGIQAPPLAPEPPPCPAPTLPQRSYPRVPQNARSLDGFLDNLFEPVLLSGSREDLTQARALNSRMKGGGGIGTQQGGFPMMYTGMTQIPSYQPAMGAMMPAPAPFVSAMPPVPSMGGVPIMPAMMLPSQAQPVVPTLSATELATQQQNFINQQAMILAQQMTTQAMTLSLEQQAQQQRLARASTSDPPTAPSKPKKQTQVVSKSSPAPKAEPQDSPELVETPEEVKEKLKHPRTFQQKRDYFQKIGQQPIQIIKVKPPAKVSIPQAEIEQEEEEEEEEEEEIKDEAPPCPPPPVAKKPLQKKEGGDKTKSEVGAGAKAEDKARTGSSPDAKSQKESREKHQGTVVRSSKPAVKRAEPSREIRNIIKMYQSRPAPVPEPIQPIRRPQRSFIKKNDPKDEALAKLGLSGNQIPPLPSALGPKKGSPPPVSPRPLKSSSSIKEKQRPLMNLFAPTQSTTSIPEPPPPPPPPLPPSENLVSPSSDPVQNMGDEHISTQLLHLSSSVSFAYASATWRLFLRKEVFYPRENFSHPYCLKLLCEQILRDTFTESCIRISPDERSKMKDMLADLQVGMDASSIVEDSIKKRIVVAARDNWANYFSRIFNVSAESGSDVQFLAVSHRGLRLLKSVNNATFLADHLKTLCSYSFAEVLEVEAPGNNILQLTLKNEQLILHTTQAQAIKSMVELFLSELKKDSSYVIALRSYVTDDRSLLSFRHGDIIKLLPMASLEPGWQFGSIGGRSGLFPSDMVTVAAVPDYLTFPKEQKDGWQRSLSKAEPGSSPQNRAMEWEHSPSQEPSEYSAGTSSVFLDGSSTLSAETSTYTMWEYALKNFYPMQTLEGGMVMSEEHARCLVQHTKVPIQKSLTKLTAKSMNDLAVENFRAVMQFMGDQPKKKDELDIIFEMLKLCKENKLKDEIYCQLIKQVTENPQQESCIRGWNLLSLLTGYFLPSSTLMPYVIKFLQDAAPGQELVQKCQEHLQRTVKYGGRQYLPSFGEIQAFLKGQISRPLLLHLPGGTEYKTVIQTFTVVREVLEEMCIQMGIRELLEVQEFAIFLIKGQGALVRPLHPNKYLNDVVRESGVELHSRRLTWDSPLHYENEVYISTHYSQVHRDYLQGKLLVSTQPQVETSLAPLVVLQLLSRETRDLPSEQDLLRYIPEALHRQVNLRILGTLVESQLKASKRYSRREAQIDFIEAMRNLPLFGYTIYIVLRVSEPRIATPCLLGLNHHHLVLVNPSSQEQCHSIALKEIQKLRQLSALNEVPGLELNYGSSANPKTIWFELPQAQELLHTLNFLMENSTST